MAMKHNRYSEEALMEVFKTPRPDNTSVIRWKDTWRDDTERRYEVKNFTAAVALLTANDVDPLFYQLHSIPYPLGNDPSGGAVFSVEKHYIVFFKEEHYVFFKLHQGLA